MCAAYCSHVLFKHLILGLNMLSLAEAERHQSMRGWCRELFPPEPLQALPKSLRMLFVRFPSPSPHQPVVNGSLTQHEEQNNEILPTVAKFATGETKKGSENSHHCLKAVRNPITYILQYGRPRQKKINADLTRVSWSYAMVCAYFSVSIAVLEMYNLHLLGIISFSTATKSTKGE